MGEPSFKSGFVAILGRPNAGKSTLLNALVGAKVAIVSAKPQTTRDRLAGIVSGDGHQIVFVDTPGVIDPRDAFNEALMWRVTEALDGVDVIYHLVDAYEPEPPNERLAAFLRQGRPKARFLVVTKTDLANPARAARLADSGLYDAVFPVSAVARRGLDELLAATIERLPEGPIYYDPEQISDRDERFLAAEAVREKVFLHLSEELPYAVFTETEVFEERSDRDFIRVVIHVERDSQKGIVIGSGGEMLKRIGTEARADIEELTGRPSFLELWVKVRKNWRKKEFDLQNFGFARARKKKGRRA